MSFPQRTSRRIQGLPPEEIDEGPLNTPLPPSATTTAASPTSPYSPVPMQSLQSAHPYYLPSLTSSSMSSHSSNSRYPSSTSSGSTSTNLPGQSHNPISYDASTQSYPIHSQVSDASSSQHDSAFHPTGRFTPYNHQTHQPSFFHTAPPNTNVYSSPFNQPISSTIHHPQAINLPPQPIPSAPSVPMMHPPSYPQYPPTHQHQVQPPTVNPQFNHLLGEMRRELQAVQQQLVDSQKKNNHLQSQIFHLNQQNRPPPIINTPTAPTATASDNVSSITPPPAQHPPPRPPTPVLPTPSAPPVKSEVPSSSSSNNNDLISALGSLFQNQNTMMKNHDQLLSKLIDNASDSKKAPSSSTFPVLSNKQTDRDEFSVWYFTVISVLATKDWSKLYDSSTQDVIKDGSLHKDLNEHLYHALLVKAKEGPLLLIRNLKQFWGNGIGLLKELRSTYYGALTKTEVRDLYSQLIGRNWSRKPDETIHSFASRTINARRDLLDHGTSLSNSIIKDVFINGLGPHFTSVIEDNEFDRLKPEWSSENILDLIQPARKLLQIKKNIQESNKSYKALHSPSPKKLSPAPAPAPTHAPAPTEEELSKNQKRKKDKDRQKRIHVAIRAGTFKIDDFKAEVPENACVYHGYVHPKLTDSSRECTYIQNSIKRAAAAKAKADKDTPDTESGNPSANRVKLSENNQSPSADENATADDDDLNTALEELTQFGDAINNNDTNTTVIP